MGFNEVVEDEICMTGMSELGDNLPFDAMQLNRTPETSFETRAVARQEKTLKIKGNQDATDKC